MAPGHIALAVLCNVIWGFSFIMAKIGVSHFPPLFFTALRFTLVALVLGVAMRPLAGRGMKILAIAMAVGTFHFVFLYLGIKSAGGVSAVAITIQLIAPFSLLLGMLFLHEHVGWHRLLAIAISFSGVMVLGFDPVVFNYLEAVGLVAIAAFSMSIGLILMRKVRGVGTFELQAWIGLICAPQVFILSFLMEENQWQALTSAGWLEFGALVFAALVTTIVAHSSWFHLLQRYPVNMLMPFGLLAPVFGVLFGVLLFSEPLSLRFLIGGAMTLGGVAIIHLRTPPESTIDKSPDSA